MRSLSFLSQPFAAFGVEEVSVGGLGAGGAGAFIRGGGHLEALGAYDATVARIQATLKALSARNSYFDPGTVDGLWGPKTKAAVRTFRVAAGLDADPGSQTQADYLDMAFETELFKAKESSGVAVSVPGPSAVVPRATPPVTAGAAAAPSRSPDLPPGILVIGGIGALLILYSLFGGKQGATPTAGLGGLIRGDKLNADQRRQVLDAFLYRWTTGNRQRESSWRGVKGKPRIKLQSDEEWLKEHAFYFTKAGKLMRNRRHAEPAYLADER